MMNSKKSSHYQLLRYGVLGVLVAALVLSLNYTKASTALHIVRLTDTIPAAKETKKLPPPKVNTNVKFPPPVIKKVKVPPAAKAPVPGSVITIHTTSGNNPVFVVDGKVASKATVDGMDPNKIESVNVVKDPSPELKDKMEKEYGAGATNGIVFVKTKQPNVVGITVVSSGISGKGTGHEPLVVVDGVVRAKDKPITDIPSESIESISVLKDQSATTLYGDAGSNGVIFVTTKAGKKGVVNVELRLSDSTKVK